MGTIRLATWNLLHGRSLVDGEVDVDNLTAGARNLGADVLALQEVDRHQRRSHGTDQTRAVADANDAAWHRFVPALWGEPGATWQPVSDNDEPGADGDQAAGDEPCDAGDDATLRDGAAPRAAYGIGLVSRWPVTRTATLRFPPAPIGMPLLVPGRGVVRVDDEPRVALAARVEAPAGAMTVIATHLSFVPGVNARQLRTLVGWAARLPGPRALLGDLNMPGSTPRLVSRWHQLARVRTYPSWRPRIQFDHVLADSLDIGTVVAADSVRTPVSDHNALVVTLARPPLP